jgi:predicted transcriptional regulator of viral defense system
MTSEEFILEKPVFTTRDYAQSLDMRIDSGSRKLASLLRDGLLKRFGKGIWFNPKHDKFTPLSFVPYLLAAEQGYVSFLSALSYHGVISQIPQKVFIATTGHARRISFENYHFDLIQIKPEYMMYGVEWKETFALATPEKSLLDCIYLSSRKGRRFYHLPELDVSEINRKKLQSLVTKHKFTTPVEVYVSERIEDILNKYSVP